jgi:hypothetical protein
MAASEAIVGRPSATLPATHLRKPPMHTWLLSGASAEITPYTSMPQSSLRLLPVHPSSPPMLVYKLRPVGRHRVVTFVSHVYSLARIFTIARRSPPGRRI